MKIKKIHWNLFVNRKWANRRWIIISLSPVVSVFDFNNISIDTAKHPQLLEIGLSPRNDYDKQALSKFLFEVFTYFIHVLPKITVMSNVNFRDWKYGEFNVFLLDKSIDRHLLNLCVLYFETLIHLCSVVNGKQSTATRNSKWITLLKWISCIIFFGLFLVHFQRLFKEIFLIVYLYFPSFWNILSFFFLSTNSKWPNNSIDWSKNY